MKRANSHSAQPRKKRHVENQLTELDLQTKQQEYRDRNEIEKSNFSEQVHRVFQHSFGVDEVSEDTFEAVSFKTHFLTSQMQHDCLSKLPTHHMQRILQELYSLLMSQLDSEDPTSGFIDFFEIQDKWNVISREFIQKNLMSKYYYGVFYLMRLFSKKKLIGNHTEETLATKDKFDKIYKVIKLGCTMLLTKLRMRHLKDSTKSSDDIHLFDISIPDTTDHSPFQRLILFILGRLCEFGYRRYMGNCYKEVKIAVCVDADGNHEYHKLSDVLDDSKNSQVVISDIYKTHSWVPTCTIEEVVYLLVDKNTDYDQWLNFTSTNVGGLFSYLKNCQDHEFMDLSPKRQARSFTNGILHLDPKNEIFYTFKYKPHIPPDMVCCKHFDQEFNTDIWNINHWFHIETPAFNKILSDQNLIPQVQALVFALLGRLLYETNQVDKWQVILFIKGVAQSGKSTIGNIVKKFFQPDDVAIMASNIEKKFGLDPIMDKMLFICYEVTKAWGLPRSDFQSLISGEEMSIAGKNKPAKSVVWKVPGLLLGNELGPWLDSAGSITRRLLICEFKKRITESDPNMDKRLEKEFPSFIFKCQQAYISCVEKYQGHGIWEKVPHYFREIREKVAVTTNPIKEFITKGNVVVISPELLMPLFVFDQCFKEYVNQKHYKSLRFSQDEFDDIFSQLGIKSINKTEEWEGRQMRGKFLIGVGLREHAASENYLDEGDKIQKTADTIRKENEDWNNSVPVADLHALTRSLCDQFFSSEVNYYAEEFVLVKANDEHRQNTENPDLEHFAEFFGDDAEMGEPLLVPEKSEGKAEEEEEEEAEERTILDLSKVSTSAFGFRISDIQD
jgi:phage/plasmid-associated DNA primase